MKLRVHSTTAKLLILVFVAFACVGCGDDEGRLSIGGAVAYSGQPITQGNIGFVPTEADISQSVGANIVDGRYEIPRKEGPQPGTYKVIIYAEGPSGRKVPADEGSSEIIDEMTQYIPPVYNERTTLEVEINADSEAIDFDLEKVAPTPRRRR